MKTKKERLEAICRIIQNEKVCNQEELVNHLNNNGFTTTQATLSRDIKQLKIVKVPDGENNYVYCLPEQIVNPQIANSNPIYHPNIEFSGNLAVIKTRPGWAMGIASDIDTHASKEILGTIAGDDTILVIPREGYSREQIANALVHFISE